VSLELRVDRALCRGSGSCVRRAPALFALDDAGKAVPGSPAPDQEEEALAAARACPLFAIEAWRGGRRVD